MAGTNFILCKQGVIYVQIVDKWRNKGMEMVFTTCYMLYFAPNQSTLLWEFCKEL